MRKLIIANWKMNNLKLEIEDFSNRLIKLINNKDLRLIEIAICPSFPYLSLVNRFFLNTDLVIGAQDCSFRVGGAYTGEVSPDMLKDNGCKYVILGHSERRKYNKEDNNVVKIKAEAAIDSGLTPIICIGETQEEKERNLTLKVLEEQIKGSVPLSFFENVIIAYEPIWAIGTGNIPKIFDIVSIHTQLKKIIKHLINREVKILYGGSVTPDNAKAFFSLENVDGLLIGGASLKAESFFNIINSID